MNYLRLLFVLAFLNPLTAAYQPSDENFPNPERGFFIQRSYNPARKSEPLSVDALRAVRGRGISLLRMIYTLSAFREAPLSEEMLARIGADFTTAKQAGLKVIPRFAYNSGPVGAPDASVERVIGHLEQLKPVFAANAGVIAFVEAGFVGAWGEWHSSTNGFFDDAPGVGVKRVNGKTRALVDKLLEVLPPGRMIALRCPRFKIELFGPEPVSIQEAFKGTSKARTGAHNDCLLASKDDMGTYTPGRLQQEKEFYHQDNLFVPQGGETCSAGAGAKPYIGCEVALRELSYLRYSTLNIDYQRQVLRVWEEGGCMREIERRMGYRFRLVESRIPERVEAGGAFGMSFTLVNDGWANLYNERPVEVVLRNTKTAKSYRLALKEDPRFWNPGETKKVEVAGGIPAGAATGAYDVLLNLPDPASDLRDRPEYSIRLANDGVWEPASGMNSFQRRIRVEGKAKGRGYLGGNWFK